MTAPPILIIHAPGTNRDTETAVALELSGGNPRIASVNDLRTGAVSLSDFGGVVLPGGFSYGDALGAGVRMALEFRTWLYGDLAEVIRLGRPVLGICNGFQALVKSGLLGVSDGLGGRRRVTRSRCTSQGRG